MLSGCIREEDALINKLPDLKSGDSWRETGRQPHIDSIYSEPKHAMPSYDYMEFFPHGHSHGRLPTNPELEL